MTTRVVAPDPTRVRRASPRATFTVAPSPRTVTRSRSTRQLRTTTAVALTVGLGTALAPAATQAKTIPITERAQLTLVKKTGTSFTHRGTAKGTYAGSVSSQMRLNSLSISGTVTIKTKGGSVRLKIS